MPSIYRIAVRQLGEPERDLSSSTTYSAAPTCSHARAHREHRHCRGALRTPGARLEDLGHELPAAPDQRAAGRAAELAGRRQIELAEAIVKVSSRPAWPGSTTGRTGNRRSAGGRFRPTLQLRARLSPAGILRSGESILGPQKLGRRRGIATLTTSIRGARRRLQVPSSCRRAKSCPTVPRPGVTYACL